MRTHRTFKLEKLSSITVKHGEQLYQRLYGLRIVECRMLGVVSAFGPVTLRQACIEIGVDKSQGSRLVAQMIQRGLLERRDDPTDQRSFYLLLTPEGQRLHQRVNATAVERNRLWLEGLPAERRADFLDGLERLTRHAQAMLAKEAARHRARELAPLPTHEQVEPAPLANRPLLVDPATLRELHAQLGKLLDGA